MPVTSDSRRYRADWKSCPVVYELHITNFADTELLIRKLEILNAGSTIASFEGTQLNMMLQRPGAPNTVDNRALGGGQRAIAYLWISADAGTRIPASFLHRITGRTQSVEGGMVRVRPTSPGLRWTGRLLRACRGQRV